MASLRVSLPPEVIEALQAQRDAFRQEFGRDPRPDDPVFFRRDAANPRPMTEAEDDLIISAMERAGLSPAIIHAHRRCGFLLTEETLTVLTEDEKAAWLAAIEEYRQLHERRN